MWCLVRHGTYLCVNIDCVDFAHIRQKFYIVISMYDLFKNIAGARALIDWAMKAHIYIVIYILAVLINIPEGKN